MNLIKVSGDSFRNKRFKTSEKELREKLTGEELETALKELPTPEEEQFFKIYTNSAPELRRLQMKMSICLDAEIETLEENKLSYKYNGKLFSVDTPRNAFNVSKKLDISRHDALIEMNNQGCINVNMKMPDLTTLEVDEINLLLTIIDKFFFLIYRQ